MSRIAERVADRRLVDGVVGGARRRVEIERVGGSETRNHMVGAGVARGDVRTINGAASAGVEERRGASGRPR